MARRTWAVAPTPSEFRKILKRGDRLHVIDVGTTSRPDVAGVWATDSYCAIRSDVAPNTIPAPGMWKAAGAWWSPLDGTPPTRDYFARILTTAATNADRLVTVRETVDVAMSIGGADDSGSCAILQPDDGSDEIALHLAYLPLLRWAARADDVTVHVADSLKPVVLRRGHWVIAVIMPTKVS